MKGIRAWWKRKTGESPLARVSRALLADPFARHYAAPLSDASGVRYAQTMRIVEWMLKQGWLERGWEALDTDATRPPRRWVRLTDEGFAQLLSIDEKVGDPS